MAAADDVAASIGVPELAPQASAPPQPGVAAQAPPQGTPGGLDPRVVWTVGGEAASDLPGRQAVASVVRNRLAAGAPDALSVVSEPGQFKAFDGVDQTAKRFPVGSPQYNALESQIAPIISGSAPPTVPFTGFRTHGYQSPSGPWNGSSPITTIGGNDFATVPYKYSGGPGAAQSVADSIGLTAAERAGLASYTGGAPTAPGANQPGSKAQFNFGPTFGALSGAAVPTFQKILQERSGGNLNVMRNAPSGSPQLPWYIPPGQVAPATAGDHWVDVNGVEHINPGGAGERALNAIQGALQAVAPDVASSIGRMTGGFAGPGRGPANALAGLFGDPTQTNQAYLQANAAQQRQYALAHHGDPYAQAGRFGGQAALGTVTSLLSPEVEAPAAFGAFARLAAGATTNALRGVLATAPSVGANPQPVAQQLATGAAAGVAAPLIAKAVAAPFEAVTGVGRDVAPEVADLANTAQSKYGINLASGQVMGANGDRGAATAYSTMLGNNADVRAANSAQRQAWQRGVTGTYGDPTGDISPEALSTNRARIGGVIGDVASKVGRFDASDVPARLDQIVGEARQVDNSLGDSLSNLANNIKATIAPDGTLSGDAYKTLTRSKGPLQVSINRADTPYAGQIKDVLDDALQRSADPADVDAFRNARWQYKNLMTVAKAARNQNNIGIDGVLTPNSLNTATTSQFQDRAFQGAGDLDELNAIRNKFMTEPPNSFTSNRAADLLGPLKVGLETGGAVGLGTLALQRPEALAAGVGSALAGYGAKVAAQAIKTNKVAGSAAGIIQRSLPNAPRSAFAGIGGAIGNAARSVEIPLSALAGVRGVGAVQQVGAQ